MLFTKVRIHRILAVLLLVVAMAAVAVPPAPIGVTPVSADSRCDQHYAHTHGIGFWRRTDAFSKHGWGINPHNGLLDHWADHENSVKDWCDD